MDVFQLITNALAVILVAAVKTTLGADGEKCITSLDCERGEVCVRGKDMVCHGRARWCTCKTGCLQSRYTFMPPGLYNFEGGLGLCQCEKVSMFNPDYKWRCNGMNPMMTAKLLPVWDSNPIFYDKPRWAFPLEYPKDDEEEIPDEEAPGGEKTAQENPDEEKSDEENTVKEMVESDKNIDGGNSHGENTDKDNLHREATNEKDNSQSEMTDEKDNLHRETTDEKDNLHRETTDEKHNSHSETTDEKHNSHRETTDEKDNLHKETTDEKDKLHRETTDEKDKLHKEAVEEEDASQTEQTVAEAEAEAESLNRAEAYPSLIARVVRMRGIFTDFIKKRTKAMSFP